MHLVLIVILSIGSALSIEPSFKKFNSVIIFGVDGLSLLALNKSLQEGKAPTFNRLINSGSFSADTRSSQPTVSYPNWFSILSGTDTSFNGIHSNSYELHNPKVVSIEGECKLPPNLFSIARMYYPDALMGAVYSWSTIGTILQPNVLNYSVNAGSDEDNFPHMKEFIKYKPLISLFYFNEIDDAGHGNGIWSEKYEKSIIRVDEMMGEILAEAEKTFEGDEVLVIVVTDHGRKLPSGQYHGSFTDAEVKTMWIASTLSLTSAKIKKNHELLTPVMNSDTTPTILGALGIEPPLQMRSRSIDEIYIDSSPILFNPSLDVMEHFLGGNLSGWKYIENRNEEFQQCKDKFKLQTDKLWGSWDEASYTIGFYVGVFTAVFVIALVVLLVFLIWYCSGRFNKFKGYERLE